MESLVLASSSPRRIDSLRSLGFVFRVCSPEIDEDIGIKEPIRLVKELSMRKAKVVAGRYDDAVVVAADTVVVLDREIYGKPRDETHAREMLRRLSGKEHRVYTGLCVGSFGQFRTDYSEAGVTFYELGNATVDWYVGTGEPFSGAGAYLVQGLGSRLVKEVRGDYNTVIGLPLDKLKGMLNGFGVSFPS